MAAKSQGYGISQQDMVCATHPLISTADADASCNLTSGLLTTSLGFQEASRLVFVSVKGAKPRRYGSHTHL